MENGGPDEPLPPILSDVGLVMFDSSSDKKVKIWDVGARKAIFSFNEVHTDQVRQ